jgi:hypothetical protein
MVALGHRQYQHAHVAALIIARFFDSDLGFVIGRRSSWWELVFITTG